MSNTAIEILLDLKSAEATAKLNEFVSQATSGLKRLAEEVIASYLSIEGLHKLVEVEADALRLEEAIGKMSKATGLSVPLITALKLAATDAGVPFEETNRSFTKFAQNLYEAATGGGKAADAFRMLGVSVLNSDGSLKSSDTALREVIKAFVEMPDGAQKAEISMALFGRKAFEMIPLLNGAQEAIEKIAAEGSPITPESVAEATTFNRTLRQLHEVAEMLFIEVANRLLPIFIDLAKQLLAGVKSAEAHGIALESLIAIFKGLITAGAVVGLVIWDIGKALGEIASVYVDNFKVAIQTVKLLMEDFNRMLVAQFNLIIDVTKGILEMRDAALHLNLKDAGAAFADSIKNVKQDLTETAKAGANVFIDTWNGAAAMMNNTNRQSSSYLSDVSAQWAKLGTFVKDLWSESGKAAPQHMAADPAAGAPVFPVAANSIKDLAAMQKILADIFKQREAMIQSDPFKTQVEKIKELLPLLMQQKEIVFSEYAAAEKQLANPNLSEQQRLAILKDLVRLQGELNGLETQERNLKLHGDFVGQMQTGIVKLNDRITDFAGNSANLALATMQRTVDGVSTSIWAAIQHTKNWGEAFTKAMGQAVQGILQMVTQYIAGKLAMAAVDAYASTRSKSDSASTTAAAIPGGIAKAGEQGGWVGILIYVGVFMAAMAALMGIASAVARERGGPVTAGMPYVVGEKRPELFIPDSSGYILPEVPMSQSSPAAAGMGQAANTPVNLHFHGGEAAAMKAIQSSEGQNFIVDLNRKNVRRIARS